MTYSPSAQREFARRLGESWKDLADHLGVRPDEVRRFPRGDEPRAIWEWLTDRRRLRGLPDALDAIGRDDLAAVLRKGAADPSAPTYRGKRPIVMVLLGALVLAVGIAIAVTRPWSRPGSASPDATGSTPAVQTTPPTGGRTVLEATISQTMDVDTNNFVGVRSYRDPTEAGRGTDVGHYPEGGTVHVVCQYSSGREITDKPWGNRPLSTRTWYKLSTPDPQWIPDMYVRIVDPSASAPPECVP
jgi:hypothetical protein